MDTTVAVAEPVEELAGTDVKQTPALRAQRGEYLAFRVGDEDYAIEILRVQEIRSYETPTRIAEAPACVKGVVNLRGVIVPIVDLRLRMGLASVPPTPTTVVIVLALRDRVVGAIVDAVSEVVELGDDTLKPCPALGAGTAAHHITGLAGLEEGSAMRTIVLLDIEALLGDVLAMPAASASFA